ncbi:hypothetical protein FB549_0552 [Delftia sp. HK171]|nr:hypothetical protein FB549_0552 [Delftia sp. HK171]
MFCELIELRRAGLRLAPKNWPEPVRGDLRVEYENGKANNSRRNMRVATVWVNWSCSHVIPGPRLAEPVLLDVLGDAMLWRGHVCARTADGICEYEQMWLIRPIDSLDAAPLKKFDAARFTPKLPETLPPRSETPSVAERWYAEQGREMPMTR